MPASLRAGQAVGPINTSVRLHVQAGTLITPSKKQPNPGTFWVITRVIYTALANSGDGYAITLMSGFERLDYATFVAWTGPPNQVVPRAFEPPLTIYSGSTLQFETASTAQNLDVNAIIMGGAYLL